MSALAMPAPAAVLPPKQAKAVPADLQRFMAFDFGTRRTGVAVGSRLLGAAQPQATISVAGDARFAQIALRLKEWEPQALVVGVPYHPDGAPHDNTLRAQ